MTVARGRDPGYTVEENATADLSLVGIVDVTLVTELRWSCPGCKTRFAKVVGNTRALGKLRTCPRCSARFFLRRT